MRREYNPYLPPNEVDAVIESFPWTPGSDDELSAAQQAAGPVYEEIAATYEDAGKGKEQNGR